MCLSVGNRLSLVNGPRSGLFAVLLDQPDAED